MQLPETEPLFTVCVVGLGKIGLPLATQYARRGWQVIGADIDRSVVDTVNAGRVPFPGEAHLDEYLPEVVGVGRLVATTDTVAAVAASRTVVVVVPLIVDDARTPEFRALDAATNAIAHGLQSGTLVLYETTLPVFTTRTRFAPALEEQSGLRLGEDLFVAFSPERVFSGRIFADLRRYPKLVGGLDEMSTQRAVAFYEAVLEFDARADLDRANGVWPMKSAEAAELAKLAETTYRNINIAFANELAGFAEAAGIDAYEVIDGANSQPFSHLHRPGVAVGGHCIPVYPQLLLSTALDAQVPRVAIQVNEDMPRRAVARLSAAMGGLEGATVVVLGAAYRGGVKETAFSGVFPLVEELREHGAVAVVHDPLYTADELAALGLEAWPIGSHCDALVVQADHAEYRELHPQQFPGVRAIYDGRNITDAAAWTAAGVHHLQLGVAEQLR